MLDCIKAGLQRYKDLQLASDFGLVEQEGTGTIVVLALVSIGRSILCAWRFQAGPRFVPRCTHLDMRTPANTLAAIVRRARIAWALLTKNEYYSAPLPTA